MPITIDTSAQDVDQQLQQATQSIAIHQQVDAKYFSDNMTGNGKRKDGLFSVDTDTINGFIKESRRLLDVVNVDRAGDQNERHHVKHTFGNYFHQSTKETEKDFRKFENNLTVMIPPVIFYTALSENIALTFPKQTGMYNFNALETTWTKITSGTIDGAPATTYAKPVIQSMRLYAREKKQASSSSHTVRKSQVAGQPDMYVLFATVLDDMNEDGDMIFANNQIRGGRLVTARQGVVSVTRLMERSAKAYEYDTLEARLDMHLEQVIGNQQVQIPSVNAHQLSLAIGDQSMSDLLKSQAMLITHQAEEVLLTFVQTFGTRMKELQTKQRSHPDVEKYMRSGLITFVQHLDLLNDMEENLISTDLFAAIYQALKDCIDEPQKIDNIARNSLRLLLSQRLHELEDIRDSQGLYGFTPQNAQVNQAVQQSPDYSNQQKQIITTSDPLVIGQAGAGSGKSHTLIGRIHYLEAQGEDLNRVLVLSFTNVAAINITNRFPGVRSETLANMFHTIYSATYPAQHLSQPSTVANSIRLLNLNSAYFQELGLDPDELGAFINDFSMRLEQFDQSGFKRVNLQQELKRLSNLIEENLDMCTHVLNAVEQTTLELEPIIIHHRLLQGGWGLNIPEAYQHLNYIITDESQDISTFEYILLLELTIHYRSQLLIIGDGSQTLYEFRNSDPRYMNALEASQVFTSHKLETNYRSKEEILLFANQFLQVIDANKYANIQLTSSQFSNPTEQSVKDTITIGNNEISGGSSKNYVEDLTVYLQEEKVFQDWFIERVKKGEQIAIMGWTRKEVTEAGVVIEALLKDNQLGHIEITNIMSNNDRPMTLLSRFARVKADTLRSLDPTHAHYYQEMERQVESFVHKNFNRASSKQVAFYYNYIIQNIKAIVQGQEWQAWILDYRNGNTTQHQIGSFLIQQLLRAETRKNAMDQYLRKQKEAPNYDKCPIILSTIHGTKGLEFDHTVVLFNEAKRGATSQESMRMMFVALSRAKTSEFIINSHRASIKRSVTDTHGGMFQTPINSAFLRTLNEVNKQNQKATATATP